MIHRSHSKHLLAVALSASLLSACDGSYSFRNQEDPTAPVDGRGSIRSMADTTLCLSGHGGNNAAVGASTCDRSNAGQVFDLSALPAIKRGDRCLDLSGGRLISYNCSGGNNQRWSGVQANDNLLLSLLNNRNLTTLLTLDLP